MTFSGELFRKAKKILNIAFLQEKLSEKIKIMSICRENVDKRLNIAFLQENAVRAVSMGEGRLDQQQVFPELPSHDEADADADDDDDADDDADDNGR